MSAIPLPVQAQIGWESRGWEAELLDNPLDLNRVDTTYIKTLTIDPILLEFILKKRALHQTISWRELERLPLSKTEQNWLKQFCYLSSRDIQFKTYLRLQQNSDGTSQFRQTWQWSSPTLATRGALYTGSDYSFPFWRGGVEGKTGTARYWVGSLNLAWGGGLLLKTSAAFLGYGVSQWAPGAIQRVGLNLSYYQNPYPLGIALAVNSWGLAWFTLHKNYLQPKNLKSGPGYTGVSYKYYSNKFIVTSVFLTRWDSSAIIPSGELSVSAITSTGRWTIIAAHEQNTEPRIQINVLQQLGKLKVALCSFRYGAGEYPLSDPLSILGQSASSEVGGAIVLQNSEKGLGSYGLGIAQGQPLRSEQGYELKRRGWFYWTGNGRRFPDLILAYRSHELFPGQITESWLLSTSWEQRLVPGATFALRLKTSYKPGRWGLLVQQLLFREFKSASVVMGWTWSAFQPGAPSIYYYVPNVKGAAGLVKTHNSGWQAFALWRYRSAVGDLEIRIDKRQYYKDQEKVLKTRINCQLGVVF